MNAFSRFLALAGVLVAAAIPAKVLATPVTCSVPIQFLLTPPAKATIDSSAANGTVLWSATIPTSGTGAGYATCEQDGRSITGAGDTYTAGLEMTGAGTVYGLNLYDTGIPGIAVRIRAGAVTLCYNGYWPGRCSVITWSNGIAPFSLYVELVKVGPIGQGGKMEGVFGRIDLFDGPNGSTAGPVTTTIAQWSWAPLIIEPNKPTCAIDLPDIPVQLADVEAGNLPNLNDTAAPKDFNVTLTCGGGDVGSTAALKMALTDQSNTANTSTELSIRSQSGDAAGVKVQILRNGTPLPFGPAPTLTSAANVWSVQTIGPNTGTVTIPLKARLIRKGALAPGQINAVTLYSVMYD